MAIKTAGGYRSEGRWKGVRPKGTPRRKKPFWTENHFPGPCKHCGEPVDPFQGVAIRREGSPLPWEVIHKTCLTPEERKKLLA